MDGVGSERSRFASLVHDDVVESDVFAALTSSSSCLRYAGVVACSRLPSLLSDRVKESLVACCLDSSEAVCELAACCLSLAGPTPAKVCAIANDRNAAFDAAVAWLLVHHPDPSELPLSDLVKMQVIAQRSAGPLHLDEDRPPLRSWVELSLTSQLPDARPDVLLHCAQVFEQLSLGGDTVSRQAVLEWADGAGAARLVRDLELHKDDSMNLVTFARVLIQALEK